ncbi:Trimethyltridecatetraene synthase [Camellia lanceoleosa]|uniref:Trimethyltridecatetraene synthase n=1 Tax=Camellia lanceoleosa TaxID=1840588 RepID=A0ACC0I2Z4_9ERIC|nr:Trimethyltridecatetraene synthase [Camellia lanceoleosa]
METHSWIVLAMAWLATLAIISKVFNYRQGQRTSPPGPKPWPIIGNLNLIGPLPHQSLHKLSQKYGHLMQLKFGSYSVVVASSAEMAKQFLKTHDHIFASRPAIVAGKYTTYNYSNITWSPYGLYWRQGRKILLTELFSGKRLESYEYIRVEERQAFISQLFALSGKPIMLRGHISHMTLSVMSRIVLGKKYISESLHDKSVSTVEEFQEMLDELFSLNGVVNVGDWIPWIDFLDLQGYVKRMKALSKKFERFHDLVLGEHIARKEEEKDFVAKDMVDVLLQLLDDPNLEIKLNGDSVKAFILDLIAGGTDTSAITLEWAMSELLKKPDLINKATKELDRVIGRERWVEERDFPQLPYLDAIVKETMRLHPVVVLLVPHLAVEDCNVAGYDIRKGTRVFINTWSMGRDPTIWDAPEEFCPERFLGKEIDVRGQSFELLPFGSGRRMCPGYSLGLKMIRSSLANMLHGFNWKLPYNLKTEDLGMEEVFGLTTVRKTPLVAVVEPRLPDRLY